MAKSKLYEEGLKVRREVLGSEYVDPQIKRAETDPLAAMLQDMVTEFCWGAAWTRPGLPRKTRSLLNLAMLTALDKPEELKTHVRGALTNGCSARGDRRDAAARHGLLRRPRRGERLSPHARGVRQDRRQGLSPGPARAHLWAGFARQVEISAAIGAGGDVGAIAPGLGRARGLRLRRLGGLARPGGQALMARVD